MLTLTFLGVGSAFAKRNFQSNALVEAWSKGPDRQNAPDDTLLIDFGMTGPLALYDLRSRPGFGYLDGGGLVHYPALRRIFITHLHGDHIGGLEELAMMNIYEFADPDTGTAVRPILTSSIDILTSLWAHSLKGGLAMLHGRYALLQDYFRIQAIRPSHGARYVTGRGFTMLDRYEFTMFPTDHIRLHRRFDWPSFGLLITARDTGETVVYSGDCRFDPDGLGRLMSAARLSFHEVQLDDHPRPVHTMLGELRALPEETRKKTFLYHYDDRWDTGAYDFVLEEFAGFATPQHRYVLFR